MNSLRLLALLLLVSSKTFSQAELPKSLPAAADFAATITSGELRVHLTTLASDEYEGRETGQPGQKKAADYIAVQFKSWGLPAIGDSGTYFQKIAFTTERWEDCNLEVNGKKFKNQYDFFGFAALNPNRPLLATKKILFLGYGIDDPKYSDYRGVRVKDAVLLVYKGEPRRADSTCWISGSREAGEWSTDPKKKLRTAFAHGAAAVLFIDDELQKNISQFRSFLNYSQPVMGWGEMAETQYAPSLFVSPTIAREIAGKRLGKIAAARESIRDTGKPKKVKLRSSLRISLKKKTTRLVGENVLGYIEGSDPKLKDELVILSAHYDHLGKRGDEVFHGADDNGSGTSTILEVCQALAEAKRAGAGPRRSVLVMPVSGEEKGLLGSEFYVNHPVFPLEKTIANVNVDMVGRVDDKHKDNPYYIYIIGSDRLSTDLHRINETANSTHTQLELDYTYNAEDDPNRYYYRSDHYNFAEKGIPAIFYFNGTHADYHRPSDTVDKINFEKMVKIGQLVFHTTWELANRDERIKVDVAPKK